MFRTLSRGRMSRTRRKMAMILASVARIPDAPAASRPSFVPSRAVKLPRPRWIGGVMTVVREFRPNLG